MSFLVATSINNSINATPILCVYISAFGVNGLPLNASSINVTKCPPSSAGTGSMLMIAMFRLNSAAKLINDANPNDAA